VFKRRRYSSDLRDNQGVKLVSTRTPILVGESGAGVFRVRRADGVEWIEKSSSSRELSLEAALLDWRAAHLPVPRVLVIEPGRLAMSALPGGNLTETSMQCAVAVTVEALRLIHAVPAEGCPFDASWATHLKQAELRVHAGLSTPPTLMMTILVAPQPAS